MPPGSLEQPPAPLPGFQGTRAPLSASGSDVGHSGLNLRWDENPREQSEGVFQPGRGNLPGVEMLESSHRRGTLASIHVFIFRPATFFFLSFFEHKGFHPRDTTSRNRALRFHSPPFASQTPPLQAPLRALRAAPFYPKGRVTPQLKLLLGFPQLT